MQSVEQTFALEGELIIGPFPADVAELSLDCLWF